MRDTIQLDPSDKVMVKTQDGGYLLKKGDIFRLIIMDDYDPLTIETLTFNNEVFEEPIDGENKKEIKEGIENTLEEEEKVIVSDENFVEDEQSFSNEEEEQMPKKKIEEEETQPQKLSEKRESFREKFLDRESQGDTWENTIIEKQDKRIEKLKRVADALDKEDFNLEEFIKDKVG